MTIRPTWTRRTILKSGAAATIATAAPYFVPSSAFARPGQPGANDRVIIGVIGTGNRARQLIDHVPSSGRVVALCDCYIKRMEETNAQKEQRWPMYQYYEDMFAQENLDAVIVATPDHSRALVCIDCCQAGLDVYAEKPLTRTIGEGRLLVKAVRKYGRILQVGSQQRTMEMNRFACELVRTGAIGTIKRVQGICYPGIRDNPGLPAQPIPEGDDWDVWQGPAEWRPFNAKIQFGWPYREYGGGEMTNWGAHGVDQIQWALGKSYTGPTAIWPVTPGPDGKVSMSYADGIQVDYELVDTGPWGGGIFTGSDAKIEINRNKFTTNPQDFVADPPDPAEAEAWEGPGWIARPHIRNWLDCIKTRELPHADVEIGHRSITVCHLANIARHVGRPLAWDPVTESFVDDAEADTYVTRPRRNGWELPKI